MTPEQTHLFCRLKILLASRTRDAQPRRLGRPATGAVHENRRLIRDCITKLRHLRAAGGSSPWLGLGQRQLGRAR